MNNYDIDAFACTEITSDFVYTQVCKMSNNKSPGIDGICPKLLKIAAPIICSSWHTFVTYIFIMSVFPMDWKAAKVTPIHKSGDKANVDNY